jgi:tRNA(fMet)-specific endonuclease VapC
MKMLDTNICSYIITDTEPWSSGFADLNNDYVISAVVAYELEIWARIPEVSKTTQFNILEFLSAIEVLPFDFEAAAASAIVVEGAGTKQRKLGNLDSLIAGHAIAKNAVLITNNEKDFSNVLGLVTSPTF